MRFRNLLAGLTLAVAPLAIGAQEAPTPSPVLFPQVLPLVPAQTGTTTSAPVPAQPAIPQQSKPSPVNSQVVPVPGTPMTPAPTSRMDKPAKVNGMGMGAGMGRGPMQPYSYPTPIHPLCVGCQGLTFPPPYPNFLPPCLPCMPFQGPVPCPPGGASQPGLSFQFHQYTRSPRDFFMLDIPR